MTTTTRRRRRNDEDDEEDDDDNNNRESSPSSTLAVLDPAALCGTDYRPRRAANRVKNRRGIIIPSMTSPNTIEKTTVG